MEHASTYVGLDVHKRDIVVAVLKAIVSGATSECC